MALEHSCRRHLRRASQTDASDTRRDGDDKSRSNVGNCALENRYEGPARRSTFKA